VSSQPAQDLHNRGWGFALLFIGFAIIVNIAVFSIHKATYLQPSASARAAETAH
jgi:hypothetical protein